MSWSAVLALAAALVAPADATAAPSSPLDGQTPVQVRARLGEPAVARAEAAGALWTYRLTRCALFVYFADEGGGLKVSGAESGPRRYGETPPDVTACLADPLPTTAPLAAPATPIIPPPA